MISLLLMQGLLKSVLRSHDDRDPTEVRKYNGADPSRHPIWPMIVDL